MGQDHKPQTGFPWGRVTGLMVACVATIMGALQGTSPAHLLYRVCVGSLLACMIVHCFARLVGRATPSR